MTLTSAAHEWLVDPARVAASLRGKRVGHELVNDLERVVQTKRHMDDAIGGGTLLPSVREDLRLVVSMLRNAAYTEQVGRRLYGVSAEMGRLAGWLAYDSDQPALAQRFWLAALRAAHASGDRATGANVLGFMSVQAALSERPRDASTARGVGAEPGTAPHPGRRGVDPQQAGFRVRSGGGRKGRGDGPRSARNGCWPARWSATNPRGCAGSPRRSWKVSPVRRF